MARVIVTLHGKEVTTLRLESGREYIFGRGDNCDVQLQDQAGISRQHFKVSDETGQWIASVISKFGELVLAGQPVASVDLGHGAVFRLAGYEFRFSEVDEKSVRQEDHSQQRLAAGAESYAAPHHTSTEHDPTSAPPKGVGGTLSVVPSNHHHADSNFEGNDEATNVGVILPGRPSLRIVKSDGTESRVELEGKKWVAGREDTCDIFLPDRKASRRQFEITSTPEGYFVTDLGSANGTVLNGDPLIPEDPRPISSGDVLSVQSLQMYFEIRDPSFEKRLVAIPQEMLAAPNLPALPRFEIINYPVAQTPGGAVRMDGDWQEDPTKKKQKTIRLVMILVIVVGGLYAMFGQEDAPPDKPAAVKNEGINRLTPQQRQLVKELYVTARNLHMQGKFENSYEQLKKLHELLPEGYEQSKGMEEDCLQRRAQQEQLEFALQEKRRIEEQKRLIDRNIRECNAMANTTYSVDAIRNCLAPTIGADPANPLVADLVGRVERRVQERDMKMANQRDYNDRVNKGAGLHQRAVDLQKKSEWYSAIDAYTQHINSSYPDPRGLKPKSDAAIKQIKTMIADKVSEYMSVAQSSYQNKNYKEAIEAAKKAKAFDPRGDRAPEFIGRARRELNSLLRPIYEDAILYEGVGRVSEAQKKWREIVERDTADGEYYQKSSLKLRNYSEQGQ